MKIGIVARTACVVALMVTVVEVLAGGMTPEDIARTRGVSSAKISPDGQYVAYTLSIPRRPWEEDSGSAWGELHVVDMKGNSRAFVTGEVHVGHIAWTPDGRGIAFLAKRGGDEHKSLYIIPIDGGEAMKVLEHETSISSYSFSPDGSQVAMLATAEEDKDEKKLKDKGFDAEIYEEQLEHVQVWIASVGDAGDGDDSEARSLDLSGSASAVQWSPDGGKLAVVLAPTPLIDDKYMKSRVRIVDVVSGEVVGKLDNPGKLGPVRWSPDGKTLAMIAGGDAHDPAAGRLMVGSAGGGALDDILPDYMGHVQSIAWQDSDTIMFVGDVGCFTTVGKVDSDGSKPRTLVEKGGVILSGVSLAVDGRLASFLGSDPTHPREVYVMKHGDTSARRLTDSNPWLRDVELAKQEVVEYSARDGLKVEGILIRPLHMEDGKRYPLVQCVHGGPEAHIRNDWVTNYSRPGQVFAAKGYVVFYPNYRGSTGRGVAYSKMGQADYAGPEFDDLVDAIEHFVSVEKIVDRKKSGITGGSYGGFASAWAATKLTEHFAASVMFVGISDQISKSGTTDIPNEMQMVHSLRWPWDHWDWFRERSPLYYVEQARTPILILHGKNDPRVHPSQSMELYRYLKVIGKTPVRLVLYPGEGHGNRKSAGRLDYCLRLLRWMDHYLMGPGGDPPAHELDYGFSDDSDDADSEDADSGNGDD